MMGLFPFQIKASTEIADKLEAYLRDPLMVTRDRILPFFQNLISITGSGKTLILADAMEQIRGRMPIEPIILWLSKGKVVVAQTLENLSSGGKYSELIPGYEVKPLLDCTTDDVQDSSKGLILVATVGKFNNKDKDKGDRKIFQTGLDQADESLWDRLRIRKDEAGIRRTFIVVYDEGHNLSDQQTELLLELEPDALIAASATARVPKALEWIINRLKNEKNWSDDDFATVVPSTEVVSSGLIKKHIQLGGYVTPMEIAVEEMITELREAEDTAKHLGLSFRPKAIYVTNTNAVDGVSIKDDVSRPFADRMARPIVIWRYLVDELGIDPDEIAVYCQLKFDAKFPAPDDFHLFSNGDDDFAQFQSGGYRHIIFNLSLQEGWDDPACSFAYIDKDMGSPDQVTQVVGRVLRQPGSEHYSAMSLNTAHFYIRTDEQGVFEAILADVRRKITTDMPQVAFTIRRRTGDSQRPTRTVLKERYVPRVQVLTTNAHTEIKNVMRKVIDFRGDKTNTVGQGSRIRVLQDIGSSSVKSEKWVEVPHSNRVRARWLFAREVQAGHPKALSLCDIELDVFDAMVEYTSKAADQIKEYADEVVEAYVQHSAMVQLYIDNPYKVDKVPVDDKKMVQFKHALHEGYSDLNDFEMEFAKAIDETELDWCRNPSQAGYSIPLLDRGRTRAFYPDFLIWTSHTKDGYVVAVDTKGDHLIADDSARKLLHIRKIGDGPELVVRLVTRGEWEAHGDTPTRKGMSGFTVWTRRDGKLHAIPCLKVDEAVQACLAEF